MGWASGSEIATKMIKVVSETVQDDAAKTVIYIALAESLMDQDWDTIDEVSGICPLWDSLYGPPA